MYFGRQATGLYSPEDQNSIMYGGSTLGRHIAQQMANVRPGIEQADAQAAAEHQRSMADSYAQAAHERNLQASEQRRRMYDSETQRMGAQQRNNVLSGLLPNRRITLGGRRGA